ncbi:MAG: hypothetical protein DWI00_09880 [Planctomycetota bacterium]|nr:MAG: hypothetical protein DWI00_09880 [Planctomycetota bacterium]
MNSREIVNASFVNFVDLENKVCGTTVRSQTSNYIHHGSGSKFGLLFGRLFRPPSIYPSVAIQLILDGIVLLSHRRRSGSGQCTPLSGIL